MILYSPIARNWLYNAHSPEKMMSALESVGSQNSARENLASKNKCFAGVFKKSKYVDEKLQLSNENLKQKSMFSTKTKHYSH